MQPIDKKVKVFYKYISDKNKKKYLFCFKAKGSNYIYRWINKDDVKIIKEALPPVTAKGILELKWGTVIDLGLQPYLLKD